MTTHTITVEKTATLHESKATMLLVVRGVSMLMTALAIAKEHGAPDGADREWRDNKCLVVNWDVSRLMDDATGEQSQVDEYGPQGAPLPPVLPTFDCALAVYVEQLRQKQQANWVGTNVKNTITICTKPGRRCVKVYREESLSDQRSVICFVGKTDGNIWKAASWKKPALNFARGNIFNLKGHRFPPYGY